MDILVWFFLMYFFFNSFTLMNLLKCRTKHCQLILIPSECYHLQLRGDLMTFNGFIKVYIDVL